MHFQSPTMGFPINIAFSSPDNASHYAANLFSFTFKKENTWTSGGFFCIIPTMVNIISLSAKKFSVN